MRVTSLGKDRIQMDETVRAEGHDVGTCLLVLAERLERRAAEVREELRKRTGDRI